jgi:hypothetical protein
MSLIDHLTPTYYRVLRLGIQKSEGSVVALYDVQVLNADGQPLDTVHPASELTPQERSAIAAIVARDQAAFEANTGLTEWEEPEV